MRNQNLRKEVTHGTISGYKHYKCRCELCFVAYRDYQKQCKAKKRAGFVLVGPKPIKHGRVGSYGYHKCRCDICVDFMVNYRMARKARKLGIPISEVIMASKGPSVEEARQCGTAEAYSFGCTCDLCTTQGHNEYLREIAA